MIKIGITGQEGFIGTHLNNTLKLLPNDYYCGQLYIQLIPNQCVLLK